MPARHHKMLIRFLQDLAEDPDFDRAMIHMPPGYAKTEYTSVLFPAWYFSRWGNNAVIAASNISDLAERNGRKVRNLVQEHRDALGYSLSADSKAAGRWSTSEGGEYFAVGVGGTALGRRADLCIIDDPVRSRQEAENPALRQSLWDWYTATIIGRMKPEGKIVIMHTRFHEDDLAGRCLAEDEKNGKKRWRVLNLPAIAEEDDQMGRQPGEPLWPEWENAEKLEAKRIEVGPREWWSQYQQKPKVIGGALFKTDKILRVPHPPSPVVAVARGWDLAATRETGTRNPDWTVGVLLGLMENGQFIVLDVNRFRGTPNEVELKIKAQATDDGYDTPVSLPQDPGQAGKWQASYMIGKLAGYIASSSTESGDKATRAGPVISQVEAGNLLVCERTWTRLFLEELEAFPAGDKDDQVDALSRSFQLLSSQDNAAEIIKYYKMINAQRLATVVPTAANDVLDDSAITAYTRTLETLNRGTALRLCARPGCGTPVNGGYITDGEKYWHTGCR